MIIFMNEYYDRPYKISGVPYYIIELMQFLKDEYNISNIYELINVETKCNKEIVHSRYAYNFPEIIYADLFEQDIEALFVSMNSLIYFLSIDHNNLINRIPKIYLLNADGIFTLFKNYIMMDWKLCLKYKRIVNKIYLLHELGFENDFYFKSGLKIAPIVRGLYFNNFKITNIISENKYFMFTVKHSTITTHSDDDVLYAKKYCISNSLQYDEFYVNNPAEIYKGLIYFRFHDYMPRLPYEFWYYNKEVKILKLSDGLEKRLGRYGKSIYPWKLDFNILNKKW